ncbi:MAG: hypothetical protein ACR2MW_10870 [Chthoniobacterales bacterium]
MSDEEIKTGVKQPKDKAEQTKPADETRAPAELGIGKTSLVKEEVDQLRGLAGAHPMKNGAQSALHRQG